mmetsp:Transcript_87516/g.245787  ORF Transcript_87516/g.245787 Transcript_87516/m.245787 type:complete len:82 (-) Transcript_87516:202-447(-)
MNQRMLGEGVSYSIVFDVLRLRPFMWDWLSQRNFCGGLDTFCLFVHMALLRQMLTTCRCQQRSSEDIRLHRSGCIEDTLSE